MSHIIRSNDDLLMVNEVFEMLSKDKIKSSLLEEVVKMLLPKDNEGNLLVGYELSDKNGGFNRYSLSDNCLRLSVDEMYKWVDINGDVFVKQFGVNEIDLFRDYVMLLILVHEIEHSYQYLMAYDKVDAPCSVVSGGYRLIIDTLCGYGYDQMGIVDKVRNRVAFNRYNKNDGRYVIERNANVEAFDLLQQLAILNEHKEMEQVFNVFRNLMGIWGYRYNNRGSFEETCRDMMIIKEFNNLDHSYELSQIERFRYGLPISKESRDKIKILVK